jgi:hypothetical protein
MQEFKILAVLKYFMFKLVSCQLLKFEFRAFLKHEKEGAF